MIAHETTQQSEAGSPIKLVSGRMMNDRMNEIHCLIANRAYELFETRGRMEGGDESDWFQAENELIHSCRHDVKESAEACFLRAELPGSFTADQLEVCVEPYRLIVSGETEVNVSYWNGKTTQTEPRARRIFRMHELAAEVDPSTSRAELRGDTLEVYMPKRKALNTAGEKAAAASSGR